MAQCQDETQPHSLQKLTSLAKFVVSTVFCTQYITTEHLPVNNSTSKIHTCRRTQHRNKQVHSTYCDTTVRFAEQNNVQCRTRLMGSP